MTATSGAGALSEPRLRVLQHLVVSEQVTAAQLAETFGVSEAAVRQHLGALATRGLVERQESPRSGGRGRPASTWRATPAAHDLMVDRHAQLSAELLSAMAAELTPDDFDAVVRHRETEQITRYQRALGSGPLRGKLDALGHERSLEGYQAQVIVEHEHDASPTFTLIEHHCPIGSSARACSALCDSELRVFSTVLGPAVSVVRTRHMLLGDQRCAYRIHERRLDSGANLTPFA
jgi:predicted ArsR family transcriptional regulator